GRGGAGDRVGADRRSPSCVDGGGRERSVDALRAAGDRRSVRLVVFRARGMKVHLSALRVHQWAKNVLLFIPVVTAHRLADVSLDVHALLGFASFCLCTSGVYLINDLVDIEVDRAHPTKRHRPLASGVMSKTYAVGAALVLLAAAFAIAVA